MHQVEVIFDWKVDAFGWPTKAKARLVARGDMQREYIDFGDRYAPTVAPSSVRMLAALACELDFGVVSLRYRSGICPCTIGRECVYAVAGRVWIAVEEGSEVEQESLWLEAGIWAVVCNVEGVPSGAGV